MERQLDLKVSDHFAFLQAPNQIEYPNHHNQRNHRSTAVQTFDVFHKVHTGSHTSSLHKPLLFPAQNNTSIHIDRMLF